MGKVTGFLEIDRQDRKYRPASDRIRNFKEFIVPLPEQVLEIRPVDAWSGIPFCHDMKGLKGCPVNNQIPIGMTWYRGEWEQASKDLHSTTIFLNLQRICPAPCEAVYIKHC